MLTTGEVYRDAGGDYFARLDPDKRTRRLVAQLERLGHVVTLKEAAAWPGCDFPSDTPAQRTGTTAALKAGT